MLLKNKTLYVDIKSWFLVFTGTHLHFLPIATFWNTLQANGKNYEAELQHLCVSLFKLKKDEWRHKDDILTCSCLMLYLDLSFRKANMLQKAYLRVIYGASSFCCDAKFISFLNVDTPFIFSLKVFQQH